MASRSGLALLVLALTLAAVANSMGITNDASMGILSAGDGGLSPELKVGELIDADEEMMMESESGRRGLQGRRRYISYEAMKANNVPCSKRGNSYYGCRNHKRVNPYTRGCTKVSRCPRNTR